MRKINPANRGMHKIDPSMVAQIERCLSNRKPDHIMEVLRISLNTWNKLLLGEPIRSSVAERLLSRFNGQM